MITAFLICAYPFIAIPTILAIHLWKPRDRKEWGVRVLAAVVMAALSVDVLITVAGR